MIYDFYNNKDFCGVSGLLQLTVSDFLEYVKYYKNVQKENEPSDQEIMVISQNSSNTDD